MNLSVFSVGSTNIFPIANSRAGGQLLTEFNLRSRESVATPPSVTYDIGPSFTHSLDDFKVTQLDTTLTISAGKALVNGHFIQSLVPVDINIADCNAVLAEAGEPQLSGKLTIGLKINYSTEQTMKGAMVPEVDDPNDPNNSEQYGMYPGVVVVILPTEGELGEKFTRPVDSPNDETKVNAHLRLATFNYTQGQIMNLTDDTTRVQSISADRIGDVDSLVSDAYVSREGLNPQQLYVYAGKGSNTDLPTWCSADDSLVVWSKNSTPVPWGDVIRSDVDVATFEYVAANNGNPDHVDLILPRKQLDRASAHEGTFFQTRILNFPMANYAAGTGGAITHDIISRIADLDNQLTNYSALLSLTEFIAYIPVLSSLEDLPQYSAQLNVHDYVIVGQDFTQVSETAETAPSTMYIILSIDSANQVVSWTQPPVRITTDVPLAQENVIGGFLNVPDPVPDEMLGQGYVWRDNDGLLRIVDWDLLKTGVLAYQLGQDHNVPAGDVASINTYLAQYVNDRVAFPTTAPSNISDVSQIHIYIEVPDESGVIDIHDIDSRFGTCVTLHFTGEGGATITGQTGIVISNCEKIKLDISEECRQAQFVVNNCGLYYDPDILNVLTTIHRFKLWYEKLDDTDLDIMVNGMTVEFVGSAAQSDIVSVDPWSDDTPNDNHYSWALKSVTFAPDGSIEGMEVLIQDIVTGNVAEGTYLFVTTFDTLTNGGLVCPQNRLTRRINISGAYTSAYKDSTQSPIAYVLTRTSFTATPAVYDSSHTLISAGQIIIESSVSHTTSISGSLADSFESSTSQWHSFGGKAST